MTRSGPGLTDGGSDDCSVRLTELAEAVFGDAEKAKRWMSTPNIILGPPPQDLLGTDEGAKRVEEELTRIEHGIFI